MCYKFNKRCAPNALYLTVVFELVLVEVDVVLLPALLVTFAAVCVDGELQLLKKVVEMSKHKVNKRYFFI
jgi:hypothetical protein